ncbi:MAG: hypothetical protein WBA35_00170 [Litorimonas sp.]
MRLSELIPFAARRTGVEQKKVKQIARDLMEHGELPKAVGRSIPDMEAEHKGKLVLALSCSQSVRGSSEAMRTRWDAKLELGSGDAEKFIDGDGDGDTTFGSLLTDWIRHLSRFEESWFDLAMASNLYVNMSRPISEVGLNDHGWLAMPPATLIFRADSYEAITLPKAGTVWNDNKGIIFRSRISGSLLAEIATGLTMTDYQRKIRELEREQSLKDEGAESG